MTNNSIIPPALNDLLVQMAVVGQLRVGQKLNMGAMTFSDANSWYSSFWRSISGEGRRGLMLHLTQIVQQASTAIHDYKDTDFCKLIVNHLVEFKKGVNSLSTTYSTDPRIIAQLSVLNANIDMQLNKYVHLIDKSITISNPIPIQEQSMMYTPAGGTPEENPVIMRD
jgi:hypothetical protein